MNIPGMAASHQIITKQCRENRGTFDAFEEAVSRLGIAYDALAVKGIADDTEIHLVLVVQQERHRVDLTNPPPGPPNPPRPEKRNEVA